MAHLRSFTWFILAATLLSAMAVGSGAELQDQDVTLHDFQQLDHASQRSYVFMALNNPEFASSGEGMQQALHFFNRMDWGAGTLNPKDEAVVSKFLQKVPLDLPVGKAVANRYFNKISGNRFSLTTGSGVQWNGESITTKGGAVLDPRKIPLGVSKVEEVNGVLIFLYKPDEPGFEPAKVTLQKGTFERGGMLDELTQPSRYAKFSVEGGDVEIGGIMFHSDGGRIEALGDDNYKIQDFNLRDDDPASIIMLGKNRDLTTDLEIISRQPVTFAGSSRSFYTQYSNGILLDGHSLHVKGSFSLALSEFEKDEPFASYTLRNNELERTYRIALPPETGIILHYNPKGGRKVWNVDSNDAEDTPTALLGRQESSKRREAQMKTKPNEVFKQELRSKTNTKQIGEPTKNDVGRGGRIEEEKPLKNPGKENQPVTPEKKGEKVPFFDKKPEFILGSEIQKSSKKVQVQPEGLHQVLVKARDKSWGEGQFSWDRLPADIQRQIIDNSMIRKLSLVELKSRSIELKDQAERGALGADLKELSMEFRRLYNQNNNIENWADKNIEKSWFGAGKSEFKVGGFGDYVVVSDKNPGRKRVFIVENKYKPLLDKLFD